MTFSRMTLGTSRIPAKPPRGKQPCVEPYVAGPNILKDPSFELHLANTGGGPNGDEIPHYNGVDQTPACLPNIYWGVAGQPGISEGDCAYTPTLGWAAGKKHVWRVVSDNPASGTYHARLDSIAKQVADGQAAGGLGGDALWMIGGVSCVLPRKAYSARVAPGDYVRAAGKFRLSGATSSGGADLQLRSLDFYDATYSLVDYHWLLVDVPLTDTYVEHAIDAFAPPNAHYVEVGFSVGYQNGTAPDTVEAYADDFVLEVT